jgi:hypothetical protein
VTDERPTGVAAADAAVHVCLTGSDLDRKLTALQAPTDADHIEDSHSVRSDLTPFRTEPEIGARTHRRPSMDDTRRTEMTTETPMRVDLVDALETNFWSMWRQFGQGHNCQLVDDLAITRFETHSTRSGTPHDSEHRTRPTEHGSRPDGGHRSLGLEQITEFRLLSRPGALHL